MLNNLEKLEEAYTHLLMIERDISEAQFNMYSVLKSHETTSKGVLPKPLNLDKFVDLMRVKRSLKQIDTSWMLVKECLEEVRDNLYEAGERKAIS